MNSSSSRKSSSTCASSERPGSLRTRRAFAKSATTSPASRPLRKASAPRPPNELPSFEEPIDAEARIAGRSGEQQASEDRRGAGGAPVYPPGHEEDGAQLQKILRPRRDQCVRGGRQGEDRGARADLEVEALDRSTGQRTGDVMSNYFSAVMAACRGRDGGGGVSRRRWRSEM